MKLIVGLGNPGKEYEKTRHNVGFLAIDAIAHALKLPAFKEGYKGVWTKADDLSLMLLKPQTFMNLSGDSVLSAMQFFKIPLEDVVIIYDDLAFEPGVFRLRLNGSSGSHNGISHIIQTLGTTSIQRIRIGIGAVPSEWKGRDYVLGVPSSIDQQKIAQAIDTIVLAVKDYIDYDFAHAMSRYNIRGEPD